MELKAVSAIKKYSKYFYSFAKNYNKIATGIGPFINQASTIVTCPQKMALMPTDQYCSVLILPKQPMLDGEDIFRERRCHPSEWSTNIIKAICEISSSAAAGPDRFPTMLLEQRSPIKTLYLIWRKSQDDGYITYLLKTANIIPNHKGETRGIHQNTTHPLP